MGYYVRSGICCDNVMFFIGPDCFCTVNTTGMAAVVRESGAAF